MRVIFKTILFAFVVLSLSSTISAQDSSPKIGEYYCYTTALETSPFGINPIAVQPAFFGNIILDGKGNYKMTRRETSGRYSFDKATSTLTFTTGDLKIMKVSGYKSNEFFIQYNSLAFHCRNGEKTTPGKPLTNPNASFTGIIVAALSYSSVDFIDLSNSKTINTFSYAGNSKASNTGYTIHLEDADKGTYSKNYPIVEIKDSKGNTLFRYEGKSANGQAWDLGGYNYGIISPDNSKFLLTGRRFQKIGTADYNYRALGDPASSVFDLKTGREIKTFPSDSQNRWRAEWLPNGEVMIPRKGGGIDITDANFGNPRTIYNQQVQFAKPSPDGKTVIFKKGSQLFTINIDGSGEKQFTNVEVGLDFTKTGISDITWSPDGKSIAIMMPDSSFSNKYTAVLLSVDGKKASMIKDSSGKTTIFIRPFISWISTSQNAAAIPPNIENKTVVETPSTTFSQQSLMAYKPVKTNSDPNFAQAFELYKEVMGDDFENFHDVAAAITYIVVFNYANYRQQDGVPTNQVRKVYQQFADQLSQIESFKNANNEAKQQLAELAILDGIESYMAMKSKNQKKINEVALRLMSKYIGKSAEKMKITDNGMEF